MIPAVSDGATTTVGQDPDAAPGPSDADKHEARKRRDEKLEHAKATQVALEAKGVDTGADSDEEDPEEVVPAAAPELGAKRPWWHRHFEPSERQRVMGELAIRRPDHWFFRFTTMMTLSVVVAVMGLSANSAAVVIGAMLLAPLMQPVLAAAACISMGLFRKSLRAVGHVLLATVWAIFLSYVLARIIGARELPEEVTSRTAPDIRDLIVALGAGTAGAYATVRKDASSSLPGVAVAVALVPPLGAVGMSVEAGRGTLAEGALLLYTTNLAAIVLAASVVFVATGFVPPRRLASTFRRSLLAAALVGAIVVAIAVPLYRASTSAVENSERQIEAVDIVRRWLGPVEATRTPDVQFTDGRILVQVRSFELPPDNQPLTDALQARFGADRAVSVEWERLERFESTTTLAPTTTLLSDEERLLDQVAGIVDTWLARDAPPSGRRRETLSVTDGVVRIDASGVGDPPSVAALISDLDAELDLTLQVQLTWLERESVEAEQADPSPAEVLLQRITAVTETWARSNGVEIVGISFDGVRASVDVVGPDVPDAALLVADIERILEDDDVVTVLFTQRFDISTTTTTTLIPAATDTELSVDDLTVGEPATSAPDAPIDGVTIDSTP